MYITIDYYNTVFVVYLMIEYILHDIKLYQIKEL